jgi:hypothetical protein
VKFLTRQEQLFLAAVLGLLLIGWSVKFYRTAHPADGYGAAAAQTK